MLNAYYLYPNKEDRLCWRNEANGNLKFSSIFRSKDIEPGPIWSKAWIKGLVPKINIFYWTIL